MNANVAIITGAASGIGLAVTEELVRKGWNVTITDVNFDAGQKLATRLGDRVLFLQSNVISYEEQAKVFHLSWEKWGQLDLVHANAGIADRADFFEPKGGISHDAPPRPDTMVIDVDLNGPIWTAYLALFYFRKNVSSDKKKKILITASSAGIYPIGEATLYTAAKHGAIGLTRAMGKRIENERLPFTVNCLCPGMVPTNIVSRELVEAFPQEMVTPISVIIKALNMVIDDDSLNGAAIECNGEQIQIRDPPTFLNDAARFTGGGGYKDVIDESEFIKYSKKKGQLEGDEDGSH